MDEEKHKAELDGIALEAGEVKTRLAKALKGTCALDDPVGFNDRSVCLFLGTHMDSMDVDNCRPHGAFLALHAHLRLS